MATQTLISAKNIGRGLYIYPTVGPFSVVDATNTSPIVILFPNHGLTTGANVTITGCLGNTAANVVNNNVTVVDANHFSLDGTTGNGTYSGGGSWEPILPTKIQVPSVEINDSPLYLSIATGDSLGTPLASTKVWSFVSGSQYCTLDTTNGKISGFTTSIDGVGSVIKCVVSVPGYDDYIYAWTLGVLAPQIMDITNVSNANPAVITFPSHGLATNASIGILGVKGATWANGTWTITKIDNDSFSIPTTGTDVYTYGGMVIKGTDGNLTVTGTTAFTANHDYNIVTINSGGNLVLAKKILRCKSLVINTGGTIDNSGGDGSTATSQAGALGGLSKVPGTTVRGGQGGNGNLPSSPAPGGTGLSGGVDNGTSATGLIGGIGGTGGGVGATVGGGSTVPPSHTGGSGGGGGGSSQDYPAGGGAYGGGGGGGGADGQDVTIFAMSVTGTVTIDSHGGNGGGGAKGQNGAHAFSGYYSGGGGGAGAGGGSAGTIVMYCGVKIGTMITTSSITGGGAGTGGAGGDAAGGGTSVAGQNGGSGTAGADGKAKQYSPSGVQVVNSATSIGNKYVGDADFSLSLTTKDSVSGSPLTSTVVYQVTAGGSYATCTSTGTVHIISNGSVTVSAISYLDNYDDFDYEWSFTINDVSLSKDTGDNQSVTVTETSSGFKILLTDLSSNPLSSRTIAYSLTAPVGSGASLSASSDITDASGNASVTLSPDIVGTYTIRASFSGKFVDFTMTGIANISIVSGDGSTSGGSYQVVLVGKPSLPLLVKVVDSGGTGKSGQTVTYVLTSSPTGTLADVSASSDTTDSNGEASVILTPDMLGDFTVTATYAGYDLVFTVTGVRGGGRVWERQIKLPIETRDNSITIETRDNVSIPARDNSITIEARGNETVDSRELSITI